MKNRRHTPEQVIRLLAQGDKLLAQGKTVEEVARHLEISEQTLHRWRNQYGGIKEFERENTLIQELVAHAQGDPVVAKDFRDRFFAHRRAQGADTIGRGIAAVSAQDLRSHKGLCIVKGRNLE